MRVVLWPLLSFSVCLEPLADGDVVLPPSVRHEVEHALAVAPTNARATASWPIPTNGLDRTQLAIRLVSLQGADGRWVSGTNEFTSAAVEVLERLAQ